MYLGAVGFGLIGVAVLIVACVELLSAEDVGESLTLLAAGLGMTATGVACGAMARAKVTVSADDVELRNRGQRLMDGIADSLRDLD